MRAWIELRRLPRRLWILAGATLINRMGTMALPFLSLYLIRGLDLPASRAAQLLALYGGVALIMAPLSGRLADRFGTGRVMLLSLTLSGAIMLLFPLAQSFAAIAAMTVVWAASTEAFRPACMAAVTESSPPELRKQAYALHRLAINLGMSLGPAAGGFLATASFSYLWWADGATTLAAAAVLALWLPKPEAPGAAETAARALPRVPYDPRLLAFLLAAVPVAMVFFQHESSLSVYLVRDLGFSESVYGLLFTVNTLLIVALEVPLNHAMAAWSSRRTLSLGAALFAVGFGAYGLAARTWELVAATVIWTFGEMVLLPGMSAYVAGIAPAHRRGEYMGLYMMGFAVAFTAGPWAGLLIYDRWGASTLWSAVFASGILSTLLFARLAEAPAEPGVAPQAVVD